MSGKRDDKSSFITKSKQKYPGRFTYRKVIYVNSKTSVILTCPTCGDFEVIPDKHLNYGKCCGCYTKTKANTNTIYFSTFKLFAILAHGFRYKYVEKTYKKYGQAMTMICPIHGKFDLIPKTHLQGSGCRKCGSNGRGIKVIVDTSKTKLTDDDYKTILDRLETRIIRLESKNN
jgi:hypothetical protein